MYFPLKDGFLLSGQMPSNIVWYDKKPPQEELIKGSIHLCGSIKMKESSSMKPVGIQDIAKEQSILLYNWSIGTHGISLDICTYLHFRKYKRFEGTFS